MAPTPYAITYGTAGTFTVAAATRNAGTVEDAHLGFVVAVTLTPSSGTPTELFNRPAHPQGIAEANIAGAAVVRALKIALGV